MHLFTVGQNGYYTLVLVLFRVGLYELWVANLTHFTHMWKAYVVLKANINGYLVNTVEFEYIIF